MLSARVRQRVGEWLSFLDGILIERSIETRLVVIGVLAKQHVLLLGPPGTAKSMLASEATPMIEGAFFQTLLTRFSTPEDVFGPLSLKALEEGTYRRLTAGYLPTASVAFIDEIFKANASILNSLLSILNERVFFQGEKKEPIDLRCIVAASNEGPDEDAGLDALDDRLLLRAVVEPLSTAGLKRLLDRDVQRGRAPAALTAPDLAEIDKAVAEVRLSADVVEALVDVRERSAKAGVQVSDRRMRQVVDVLCALAALDGDADAQMDSLGVLRQVLWRAPEDALKVDAAMRATLGVAEDDELVAQVNERIAAFAGIEQRFREGYSRPDPTEQVTKAVGLMKILDERLAAPVLAPRDRTLWGPLLASTHHAEAQRQVLTDLRDKLATHAVFDAISANGAYVQLAKEWWQRFPRRP